MATVCNQGLIIYRCLAKQLPKLPMLQCPSVPCCVGSYCNRSIKRCSWLDAALKFLPHLWTCWTKQSPFLNTSCDIIQLCAAPPTITYMWLAKHWSLLDQLSLAHPCRIMASTVEEAVYLRESVILGHHVYKAVWNPVLGEVHCLVLEEGNKHDHCVEKGDEIIGHVPRELSTEVWRFLRHGGRSTCEVIGRRKCRVGTRRFASKPSHHIVDFFVNLINWLFPKPLHLRNILPITLSLINAALD